METLLNNGRIISFYINNQIGNVLNYTEIAFYNSMKKMPKPGVAAGNFDLKVQRITIKLSWPTTGLNNYLELQYKRFIQENIKIIVLIKGLHAFFGIPQIFKMK